MKYVIGTLVNNIFNPVVYAEELFRALIVKNALEHSIPNLEIIILDDETGEVVA